MVGFTDHCARLQIPEEQRGARSPAVQHQRVVMVAATGDSRSREQTARSPQLQ